MRKARSKLTAGCGRLAAALAVLMLAGCSMMAPSDAPTAERGALTLRHLQISSADGHHTVMLRLSQSPSAVRYSSVADPAQIIIDSYGPAGNGDLPEKVLPQDDPYVSQVRVSREGGMLRVILDMHGEQPPRHQVHEMADWLMIRLADPR